MLRSLAESRRILGQAYPAANTLTAFYTVRDGSKATCSTFTVCNQSNQNGTFRISVARQGQTDTSAQYLYFDHPIRKNRTFAATIGMTLLESDVVRCYSSNGQMSFNLFGAEATR